MGEPQEEKESHYLLFELYYNVGNSDASDGSRLLFIEKSFTLKPGSNRFGSVRREMGFIDER